jgi:hypothetical protein
MRPSFRVHPQRPCAPTGTGACGQGLMPPWKIQPSKCRSSVPALSVFTVGVPEVFPRAFRQKLEPDRTSISSSSSDVSCVGLTFCRIFFHTFSLERNAGTFGTLGTSKKAVLRFIDRGPKTLLERTPERPLERLHTVNTPTYCGVMSNWCGRAYYYVESKTCLSDTTCFRTTCISACRPASASISRQREVQILPNFTPVILRW